tara:strand:- start:1890 stop:2321 length:432 start_codon:yes stop_codon:yes gene_type:complete
MLTKKVKKRILFITLVFFFFSIFVLITLKTLNNNLLYFNTPTDVFKNNNLSLDKKIRLGGMVKKNSIVVNKEEIKFIITDFQNEIIVSFKGSVPNLFSEEKGVIAEGKLKDKKFFIASRILAKHDENYMPPELKDITKKKDAK